MLLRRLGRGGMAEVFLARTADSETPAHLLAIKRLLQPFNSDRQLVSMLADEARLSIWLNHRAITQVFDFGVVNSQHYLAMEYVDGCDLCRLVRRRGQTVGQPLELATALFVASEIAAALSHAHRRCDASGQHLGIIHRDVSPHNVLVSRHGEVKLADFGLARTAIAVHESHEGIIRGKFAYMPSEQAEGADIDHRIDVFAAGATLYEILCGRRPYTSTTLAQQLYQLQSSVPPPSSHNGLIPPELDDLTMQAMNPDADGRYQSAAEFAEDLTHALHQLSTPAEEMQRLAARVEMTVPAPRVEPAPALRPLTLDVMPATRDSLIGEALDDVRRGLGVEHADEELATIARAHSPAPIAPPRAKTEYLTGDAVAFSSQPEAVALQTQRSAPPPAANVSIAVEASRTGALSESALRLPSVESVEGSAGAAVAERLQQSADSVEDAKTLLRPRSAEYSSFSEPAAPAAVKAQRSAPRVAPQQSPRVAGLAQRYRAALVWSLVFTTGLALGWLLWGRSNSGVAEQTLADSGQSGPSAADAALLAPVKPDSAPSAPPDVGTLADSNADAHHAVSWYFVVGRRRIGPVSTEAILRRMARGEIGKGTYVWRAGFEGWRRLPTVAELNPPREASDAGTQTLPKRRRPANRRRPHAGRRNKRQTSKKAPRAKQTTPIKQTGYLTVRCGRPATVFVDGRKIAPTPMERRAMPAGIYRVKVMYRDNQSFSSMQWVTIGDGATVSLSF